VVADGALHPKQRLLTLRWRSLPQMGKSILSTDNPSLHTELA